MKKIHLVRGLAVLAIAVAGCGGYSTTGPDPDPVVQPYSQTVTGTVSVFGTTRHPTTIPRAGNMTVALTWTDASVDLDLLLSSFACVELYPLSACGILAASDGATGTNESIARTVAISEQFQIWVDNLDDTLPQNYPITININ